MSESGTPTRWCYQCFRPPQNFIKEITTATWENRRDTIYSATDNSVLTWNLLPPVQTMTMNCKPTYCLLCDPLFILFLHLSLFPHTCLILSLINRSPFFLLSSDNHYSIHFCMDYLVSDPNNCFTCFQFPFTFSIFLEKVFSLCSLSSSFVMFLWLSIPIIKLIYSLSSLTISHRSIGLISPFHLLSDTSPFLSLPHSVLSSFFGPSLTSLFWLLHRTPTHHLLCWSC